MQDVIRSINELYGLLVLKIKQNDDLLSANNKKAAELAAREESVVNREKNVIPTTEIFSAREAVKKNQKAIDEGFAKLAKDRNDFDNYQISIKSQLEKQGADNVSKANENTKNEESLKKQWADFNKEKEAFKTKMEAVKNLQL